MQARHRETEVVYPLTPGHVLGGSSSACRVDSIGNNLQQPTQGGGIEITEQAHGGVDVEVDAMDVDELCPPETPAEDAQCSQPHSPDEQVSVDQGVQLRMELTASRTSPSGHEPEVRCTQSRPWQEANCFEHTIAA
jgi:hypothetical protein